MSRPGNGRRAMLRSHRAQLAALVLLLTGIVSTSSVLMPGHCNCSREMARHSMHVWSTDRVRPHMWSMHHTVSTPAITPSHCV